jgi:D-alanyl-D-alanine carboxypeptidase (penicillin-binding protein 5/6)
MKSPQNQGRPWRLKAVAVVIVVYSIVALILPLPAIKPASATLVTSANTQANLAWPSDGDAAVGVYGTAILETNGSQTAVPTASTAKLLTALSVLNVKPITPGNQGPVITLGARDVALYNSYVTEDGSVVPVSDGEHITEYDMLEGMMLPSANNMADSLAIWAFGSLANYSSYANKYAAQLGMTNTHVGSDASGFNPSTTSTPRDLVKLGEAALANPVLAQIVGQSSATGIPLAGTVKNVNQLLGVNNIVGIKTGNSDQAGGVFISASTTVVNGKTVRLVTALDNAPNLYDALYTSLPLITSAQANFADETAVPKSSILGFYQLPWGGRVSAIAKSSLSSEVWKGSAVTTKVSLKTIPGNTRTNTTVGSVSTTNTPFSVSESGPAILQKSIVGPSLLWKLLHPKGLFS